MAPNKLAKSILVSRDRKKFSDPFSGRFSAPSAAVRQQPVGFNVPNAAVPGPYC
jgi:hypothetical protein